MRSLLCLTLFLLPVVTLIAQPPGAVVDVERYIFNVELNDRNDSVSGKATIRCKLLGDAREVRFDFVSLRLDGKGMKTISVTENGRAMKYMHTGNVLSISLGTIGKAGEFRTFEITYAGLPADGLIITKNKFNQRTFFSDHWPNRARNWLPCIDHPADKAAVEFVVIAPAQYEVVSNGTVVENVAVDTQRKRTHYKEDIPLSTKIFAIGVADFAVRRLGELDRVPVEAWVFPQDSAKGFYDYELAYEMLPFFTKRLTPFPFKKLANVQSKTVYGGMENAGAIFYAENSITGGRTSEVLIAHEISHQWFGDMATEADFSHVWLSEGFVTYLAILYMEQKYGSDTAIKMRLEDRMQALEFAKKKLSPIVDSSTQDYLSLLNANSYQKAGFVLHMLHKQLGDTIFWKSLRAYYSAYAGKNAITDDFRKIVEQVSGQNLEQFFRQWFFTPGHPVLDIQWRFDKSKSVALLTVIQKQPTNFKFPLRINVTTSDGKKISRVFDISTKTSSFTIPVSGMVRSVIADPEVDLFFEGGIRQVSR